ncbi:MAG: helix-turn-helix domain-containing protein [Chloroflexi bacterium]|nr:helix-turn-helix domain-containing protein [Chloroflexota bacterium]
MARFGEMLREARETRGLSLSDVEEATKIRQKYLEAMEEGNYARLPPRIYMRGFLKNLADFLEIDSAMLISAWANDAPPEQPQPRVELTVAPLGRPFIDWAGILPPLFLLILVILAGFALVTFRPWERVNIPLPAINLPFLPFGPMAATTPAPDISSVTVVQTSPSAPPAVLPPASPTVAMNDPSPTGVPAVLSPVATGPATGSSAPAATPPPTPTFVLLPTATATIGVAEIRLQLVLTGVSWVQVITDSQPSLAFQGTIQSGNTRTFTAQQRIQLRVGNAGGVKVSLNGREEQSLGGVGDVVDREWFLKPEGIVTPTPPTRPTSTP